MSDPDSPRRRTVLRRLGAGGLALLSGATASAGASSDDPPCSPYECPSQYPDYPAFYDDDDSATSYSTDYDTDHHSVAKVYEPQAADYADSWEVWMTTSSFVSTTAREEHPLDGYIDYIMEQETVCTYEEGSGTSLDQKKLDGWYGAKGFTQGDDSYGWDDFAFDTVEYGAGFVPYVGTGSATWSYLDSVASGVSENIDNTEEIKRRWYYDDDDEAPLPGGPWKGKTTTYVKFRADMNESTTMDITLDNEPTTYDNFGKTHTTMSFTLEAPDVQPQVLTELSDEKLAEMGIDRIDADTIRRDPGHARRLGETGRRRVQEGGSVYVARRTDN